VPSFTPDRPIRWGILATGSIAHTFAEDLAMVPSAELAAVGSRSLAKAERFVATYGGTPHGSYEELVSDPAVDVVYVATPHALHLDNARLALEAGKHVLCEKPLTLDTREAEEMVALSRRHDLFLMEAMWMACHPGIRSLSRQLAEGRFGTPRQLHAELGFRVDAPPTDRMLDPALGGGALLDMGVYPLTFAHLMLGPAGALRAVGDVRSTPAGSFDLDVAVVGRYTGGALATMTASMTSWSTRRAHIATDLGRIEVDDFHHPSRIVFTPSDADAGGPVEVVPDAPVVGRGYGNEILEVHACLRAGLRESPMVPHEQTLTIMRQMDDLRRQVGVVYAADVAGA
jgi:predicted dehydrogenase